MGNSMHNMKPSGFPWPDLQSFSTCPNENAKGADYDLSHDQDISGRYKPISIDVPTTSSMLMAENNWRKDKSRIHELLIMCSVMCFYFCVEIKNFLWKHKACICQNGEVNNTRSNTTHLGYLGIC